MNARKLEIIRNIEKSVPKEWRDNLIVKRFVAPDLRQSIIEELEELPGQILALEGEEKAQMEKHYRRLRNVFEAGFYDATEHVVDQEMAKKIEDFIEAGIQAAIDRGELSDDDKELKQITKKLKRNAKRNTKHSLRSKQG